MATHKEQLTLQVAPVAVWDAVRDVGALATRLVRGFVIDVKLEPGVRVVTFANGAVVREPIVTIDDDERRLVWSAMGGAATHYNASLQVFDTEDGGSRVLWIADFLPDAIAPRISAAMQAGVAAMRATLEAQYRSSPTETDDAIPQSAKI